MIRIESASNPLSEGLPNNHHLRRKHRERRPKFGRKKRDQVKIPDLVPISLRGELEGFGHFEADSMVGKNHWPKLSVHYERASQWTRLHKLESMREIGRASCRE